MQLRALLCAPVRKSGGNGIVNLEWECADLEWNICTEREEQPTGFLWRYARLFWLVKFAQLLSKCPSRTKLCQERSGTVSLGIPSVMLFQTACSVRASRAGENGCMRRKLSSYAFLYWSYFKMAACWLRRTIT